jgi:hypothetical protein
MLRAAALLAGMALVWTGQGATSPAWADWATVSFSNPA